MRTIFDLYLASIDQTYARAMDASDAINAELAAIWAPCSWCGGAGSEPMKDNEHPCSLCGGKGHEEKTDATD